MPDNPYEAALDEFDAAVPGGTPAVANPYEAALANEPDPAAKADAENQSLTELFHRAQLDQPVEKRAQVLALSKETNLHTGLVEAYFDKIKSSYEATQTAEFHGGGRVVAKFDAATWRKENPELAAMILQHPEQASVAMRDPELSVVAKLANIFLPSEEDLTALQQLHESVGGKGDSPQVAALKIFGATQFKPGPKQAFTNDAKAKLLREDNSLAAKAVVPIARYIEAEQGLDISRKQFTLMRERLMGHDTYELEKELVDLKREHVQRDYGEGTVGQVFSDVANAAASTVDVLEQGTAAGAAGGTIAGGLTYLATRSKGAAARAFLKGASVTGKAGAVVGTFRLEAGDAYGELLDSKTDDGRPLDNKVATGAALLYGTLASAIEFASWGPIFKAMGPLGALIEKGEKKAALEAMVKNPTFRVMAKRAAEHWLASAAAEGGEETLQSIAQDAANYFARSYQQGALSTKGGVEGEKALMAGQKGFIGGAGLATVEVGTDVLSQKYLRDNSIEGAQKVAAVASTAESPTLQASAEGYAQVVEHATGKTGKPMSHAYVDARAFEREALSAGLEPSAEAEKLLGRNGGAQLQGALESGGRLEVPVADFAKFAGTELGQKLVPETQAGADLMTVRELADQLAAEKEAQKAAAEADSTAGKVKADFENAGAAQQLTDLYGDAETGALNERGYKLAPVPPGYDHEATFEWEGQKFFNDQAHDYTTFDALLRKGAAVLREASPVVARVGGALKARFRDAGEAQRVAAKLTEATGGQVRVVVAATKGQARAAGQFAHRGSPPLAFLKPGEHEAFGRVAAAKEAQRQALTEEERAAAAPTPEDVQLTDAATARAAEQTKGLVAELKKTPAAEAPVMHPTHAAALAKLKAGEAAAAVNTTPDGLHTKLGWQRLRRVAKKAHVAFADARGFGDMRAALVKVLGTDAGEAAMDELAGEFFARARRVMDPRDDAARLNSKGDELLAQGEDPKRVDRSLKGLAKALGNTVFYAIGPDGRVFVQRGLQFVHALGPDEHAAAAAVEELKPGQLVRKPEIVSADAWKELRRALPGEHRQLGVDQGVGGSAGGGRQGGDRSSRGGGPSQGGPRGGSSQGAQEVAPFEVDVEQAERSMGLLPIFRSAAEAGMNADQWQQYLEVQQKARTNARQAAELRARKDERRQLEQWWKDEEAKERAAAGAMYDELPVVKALDLLKGSDELDPHPLDRASVEAVLGKDAADQLAARGVQLIDENGTTPDELADLLGFPTGEAMLEALAAAPTREQYSAERAAEAMQEKHPALADNRQLLQELIAKGLHGSYGEKWLLENLKALRQLATVNVENPEANRVQALPRELLGLPVAPAVDAARRAQDIVAMQRIGTLSPARALQLERQAGRAALEASARKNYAGAFIATLRQLLNMQIWKQTVEARDARDAFLELGAELAGEKARAKLNLADPAFARAADLVLEAVGFKEREDRAAGAALPSIANVVDLLEGDEASAMFDEDVLDDLVRQPPPLRDMTVEQMREAFTYLKNVEAAARLRTTAVEEGRRVAKGDALQELSSEAEMNRAHTGPVSSSESAETLGQLFSRAWTEFDGSGLRLETLARWLGGDSLNSAWRRYVIDPLQKAKHKKADLIKKVIAPLVAKLEEAMKDGRFMAKVDGKELFPQHREDLERPRYAYEIFMLLLHAGTQSSLDRLIGGRGITEEQLIAAVNKHLWPAAVKLVQAIWDANESLWPESKALEERMSGIAPPKLEARPLSTAHGELAGGYMAAKYDSRVEQVGELQEGQALGKVLDPSHVRPGTDKSRMKKRAQDFAGALLIEPGMILRVLDAAVHDIAFREPLKSVAGLIWDPKLQRVLRERLGTGRANQFKQWLRDVGTQAGAQLTDFWSQAGRAIKKRTVMAALAYRIPTALGDLSNFLIGARRIGPGPLLAGIQEFMSRSDATEFAYKKSGELRTRKGELIERFTQDLQLLSKRGGKARVALSWFDRHGFTIFEWTERMFSVPAWLGAYRDALARGQPDSTAVKYADDMIRRMLPSWNPVDQSAIQRNRYLSPFLMFGSFHNVIWNEIRDELEPVSQAVLKDEYASAAKRAMVAIPASLFIIFSAYVVGELLTGRGPEAGDGDDEAEKWIRWLARKMFVGSLMPLPVIGQELGPAFEQKVLHKQTNPRGGIYTSWLNPLVEATAKMLDGEKGADEKAMAMYRAIAPLLGTPTYPLTPAKYSLDLARGDTEPRGPGDVAGGAVYGEKKSRPENLFTIGQDLASGRR